MDERSVAGGDQTSVRTACADLAGCAPVGPAVLPVASTCNPGVAGALETPTGERRHEMRAVPACRMMFDGKAGRSGIRAKSAEHEAMHWALQTASAINTRMAILTNGFIPLHANLTQERRCQTKAPQHRAAIRAAE